MALSISEAKCAIEMIKKKIAAFKKERQKAINRIDAISQRLLSSCETDEQKEKLKAKTKELKEKWEIPYKKTMSNFEHLINRFS